MTGHGMCGVFIPDRVLAGKCCTNGKVSDRMGAGRCTAGCGRGRYLSACAGGITVVYSVAVSFP